ncbi:MAG: Gfo/Idh/MocA family oxidoreductase, partial [Rickettsiales bacterium]|nr:Gfo/Idh/MocA family oxidoreductase [Rickettsiales bacterium]
MTRILLIGAGAIAHEYIKALKALGYSDITILSRSAQSSEQLMHTYQLSAAYGGAEAMLPELMSRADAAIVASPIDTLAAYAELLAPMGSAKILLEKPAFLYSSELKGFITRYPNWQAGVVLNRLFYPSVMRLKEILAEETVTSAEFSFTEWVHRIDTQQYAPLVLARWGLSNCIHVIATVFDLIGLPATLHAAQHGKEAISWHPNGSIFSGSGVTA